MEIKKAVITAAGRGQRALPLQSFVDRDGEDKTALQIVIHEVLSAGVEQICIVVSPGDQEAYRACAPGKGVRSYRGLSSLLGCARSSWMKNVTEFLTAARNKARGGRG